MIQYSINEAHATYLPSDYKQHGKLHVGTGIAIHFLQNPFTS